MNKLEKKVLKRLIRGFFKVELKWDFFNHLPGIIETLIKYKYNLPKLLKFLKTWKIC